MLQDRCSAKGVRHVEEGLCEKASLIKQKVKLKTAVEIKKAEAFMQISSEGRNQFCVCNDQKCGSHE